MFVKNEDALFRTPSYAEEQLANAEKGIEEPKTETTFEMAWKIARANAVIGIVAMYEYSLAYYIFLDDPDISITEAINLSKDLMKGHKMDMFILDLSFILWYIASLFTFGLLLLYVIPYQKVAKALFYNQIINEYLDEQEDI